MGFKSRTDQYQMYTDLLYVTGGFIAVSYPCIEFSDSEAT